MYYLQSRYYDPAIGRFINADGYLSTGQGFAGYNMFAYCLNNPVNGADLCGTCFHRWDIWNDCEKCGGKTALDKLVEYYEYGLTATISAGGYISANVGMYDFTGSVEFAFDLKGNVQIVGSGSFDITSSGSLSASAGLSGSVFAIPDTSYLAGDTYYTGGSVFVPNPAYPTTSVGLSGNLGETSDGHLGVMGTLGVGTLSSTGVEFHGGYTRTVAFSEQFNVFEWIVDAFQLKKEIKWAS